MARSSASVEVPSYPCLEKASMAFFNAASLSNSLGRAIAQSARDYILRTLLSRTIMTAGRRPSASVHRKKGFHRFAAATSPPSYGGIGDTPPAHPWLNVCDPRGVSVL